MSTSCKAEHDLKASVLTLLVPGGISTNLTWLFGPGPLSAARMMFLKRTKVRTWGFLKTKGLGFRVWGPQDSGALIGLYRVYVIMEKKMKTTI